MKILIIFLYCITVLCSCVGQISDVSIKSDRDTIRINEIYHADIYITYNDSIVPEFTFYSKKDTFMIPFNEEEGCAVFQSIGKQQGKNTYFGNVNYLTKEGKLQNEKIEINFYVVP